MTLREGASANCLMAYLPEAQRSTLLDVFYTPGSRQWQAAALQLQAIRDAGYALSSDENRLGLWCVSAPLFAAPNRSVGVITLMVPVSRMHARVEALKQMTVVTAARISRKLIQG